MLKKIYSHILNYNKDRAFSSVDLVGQCLIDETRTKAFRKAIQKIIKRNHVVLDVGTGSGILALFAAQAGAKKVYAIEYDPYIAEIANNNFASNSYSKKIKLIVDDARKIKFSRRLKFDVVIMEMLTTGMIDEFQIQAVNNLYEQKAISNSTIFIPEIQKTYISLAEMDFSMYGFRMEMVKHLWHGLSQNQKYSIKSEQKILNSISFDKKIDEIFNLSIPIEITKTGLVNCINITGKSFLTSGITINDTETLNAPLIIPIKKRKVSKGDTLNVYVNYKFGGGFKQFKAEIKNK